MNDQTKAKTYRRRVKEDDVVKAAKAMAITDITEEFLKEQEELSVEFLRDNVGEPFDRDEYKQSYADANYVNFLIYARAALEADADVTEVKFENQVAEGYVVILGGYESGGTIHESYRTFTKEQFNAEWEEIKND